MSKHLRRTQTIQLACEDTNGDEFFVTVEYIYKPRVRASIYTTHGDPGSPEEPSQINIESIHSIHRYYDELSNIPYDLERFNQLVDEQEYDQAHGDLS